mgnify:CR=1 FL=1
MGENGEDSSGERPVAGEHGVVGVPDIASLEDVSSEIFQCEI